MRGRNKSIFIIGATVVAISLAVLVWTLSLKGWDFSEWVKDGRTITAFLIIAAFLIYFIVYVVKSKAGLL